MTSTVPMVNFSNGQKFPILGLGTWKLKPEEATEVIKDAIDIGYRHFDCAYLYSNEKEIGQAIRAKIAEGVVKRSDLYITGKLWNTFHRPDLVEKNIQITLKHLGIDYLDLYLVQWPFALKEGEEIAPVDANGHTVYSDVDYIDTWKAMEVLCEKGLTKSIGISNFNASQIERLLQHAKIIPVTNQIECHPYLSQLKLSEFCKSKNIFITAYSPLGSPDRPWSKSGDPNLLEDTIIKQIAKKYKKSPAQVLLKYQVQRGHIVVPKAVAKSRLKENFEIWNFDLSADDIVLMNLLDRKWRICFYPNAATHKYYPFSQTEEN